MFRRDGVDMVQRIILAAPALAVVPFAALGAVTIAVLEPGSWAGALALCVPVTWVGIAGGV